MNFLKCIHLTLFFFLVCCSFDNKTGIWNEHNKKIIKEAKIDEKKIKIFQQDTTFNEDRTPILGNPSVKSLTSAPTLIVTGELKVLV